MAKKKTFEEALNRLEEIVSEMEDPKTGLEDSVKLYKEGVELSLFCSNKLNMAEQQVMELRQSSDGKFIEKNFNNEEE